MADPEIPRAFPRRRPPNFEMFCYRAAPSAVPQMRRNIGQEIVDISQGGARVRVSESVPRGETVTLELRDRSSGESFRARGEVRWARPQTIGTLVGVQFNEHYTPVGLREYFTTGSRPAATAPGPQEDIMLAPPEKRASARFSVEDYVVTVFRQGTLAAQGIKRNLARQVLDLSQTGAQVSLSDTLEPGALVQFTLHLNALSDTLDVLAAIRWCRPDPGTGGSSYRAGLQFLNLPDDRRRMIDFLRKHFTKSRRR